MVGGPGGRYSRKTKKQLIDELVALRAKFAELKKSADESKCAEEVLKQGELVAAATIEGMTDGVMLVNMSGEIIYVNKAFEKSLGYKAKELVGTSALKLPTYSKSKDMAKAQGYLKRVIEKGSAKPLDMNAITKDGKEIPINFTASVIKDAQGNPKTLVAVIRDVTERKKAEEEVRRYTKQLEALSNIGATVSQTLNLEELLDDVLDTVLMVMGVEVGGIFLLDKQTSKLLLKTHRGMSPEFARRVQVGSIGDGFIGQVAKLGKPILAEDVSADAKLSWMRKMGDGIQSFAAVPIMAKEKILAVMAVGSVKHREFPDWEMLTLDTIANQIGMAIENAQLYEHALEIAFTDSLTGLYNRRYIMDQIGREFIRAQRNKATLSLVMVDLDGLKAINDRFGHHVGDRFLKEVARVVKVNTRASDVAARWGGDEFMFLAPGTDSRSAIKIAERIRAQVERYKMKLEGKEVGITISSGIVAYPDHASVVAKLLKKADEALYNAKRGGKNQSYVCAHHRRE
jgi:diguanylate cyclase (GGDEF)-like protein/PAS domain S-box-containing protein